MRPDIAFLCFQPLLAEQVRLIYLVVTTGAYLLLVQAGYGGRRGADPDPGRHVIDGPMWDAGNDRVDWRNAAHAGWDAPGASARDTVRQSKIRPST